MATLVVALVVLFAAPEAAQIFEEYDAICFLQFGNIATEQYLSQTDHKATATNFLQVRQRALQKLKAASQANLTQKQRQPDPQVDCIWWPNNIVCLKEKINSLQLELRRLQAINTQIRMSARNTILQTNQLQMGKTDLLYQMSQQQKAKLILAGVQQQLTQQKASMQRQQSDLAQSRQFTASNEGSERKSLTAEVSRELEKVSQERKDFGLAKKGYQKSLEFLASSNKEFWKSWREMNAANAWMSTWQQKYSADKDQLEQAIKVLGEEKEQLKRMAMSEIPVDSIMKEKSVAAPIAICIIGKPGTRMESNANSIGINLYMSIIQPVQSFAHIFLAMHGNQTKHLSNFLQFHAVPDERIVSWTQSQSMHASSAWRGWGNEAASGFTHCKDLISRSETSRGKNYEWVLRLHMDRVYGFRLPAYEQWPKITNRAAVWVDYLGGCEVDQSSCLADQIAFLTRPAMSALFDDGVMSANFAHEEIGCRQCVLGNLVSDQLVFKATCDCKVFVAEVGRMLPKTSDLPVLDMAKWVLPANAPTGKLFQQQIGPQYASSPFSRHAVEIFPKSVNPSAQQGEHQYTSSPFSNHVSNMISRPANVPFGNLIQHDGRMIPQTNDLSVLNMANWTYPTNTPTDKLFQLRGGLDYTASPYLQQAMQPRQEPSPTWLKPTTDENRELNMQSTGTPFSMDEMEPGPFDVQIPSGTPTFSGLPFPTEPSPFLDDMDSESSNLPPGLAFPTETPFSLHTAY